METRTLPRRNPPTGGSQGDTPTFCRVRLKAPLDQRHKPAEVGGEGVGERFRFGEEVIRSAGQGEGESFLAEVQAEQAEGDASRPR